MRYLSRLLLRAAHLHGFTVLQQRCARLHQHVLYANKHHEACMPAQRSMAHHSSMVVDANTVHPGTWCACSNPGLNQLDSLQVQRRVQPDRKDCSATPTIRNAQHFASAVQLLQDALLVTLLT